MAINVSTCFLKFSIPVSAFFFLWGPSKENGFVTIPTVSIPISLANSAMIGAAPVPVPPPIPAVMNNMSVPSNMCLIFSFASSAASLALSGSAPAPNPFVALSPKCILWLAFDISKSCESVFAATKSTPLIPLSIMSLIAFPPAPPTPITLIVALFMKSSI